MIETRAELSHVLELEEQRPSMEEYCRIRWFLGQPMGSRCSSGSLGVVRMLLGRNTGKVLFFTAWRATVPALVVLSSLLVAQNVPPEFPSASTWQCSISALSTHCQARRFDSAGSAWTSPVRASAILLPRGRQNWKLIPQLLPAIQIKGFHFNRPPPIN